MGLWDRLLGREKFSQWSVADKAMMAWWLGQEEGTSELVTPQTVMGLSAVLRSVQVISTTIAGLPLRSYERYDDGDRTRIPTDFDDPYPGPDGLTPFSWTETVLIHLLLWRHAFLWHEPRADGSAGLAYRPIQPDVFTVKRVNGKRVFEYKDENNETKQVGSDEVTYIPGPSMDGLAGHPLLWGARAIFSAAISGDRTAQTTLRRGIRLGGLLTPADDQEEVDQEEVNAITEIFRARALGPENAGDIAVLNRRMKLNPWTPNNIESQWAETRNMMLGEIGRLFGVPPHLLSDTEKQTSWGTGVAEQNLGLARYTLRGWSDRIEQVLTRQLGRDQFVEYDYRGLLQGTPAQEIELLLAQVEAGVITVDEYRKIQNLPPLTPAQKAEAALLKMPQPVTDQTEAAA